MTVDEQETQVAVVEQGGGGWSRCAHFLRGGGGGRGSGFLVAITTYTQIGRCAGLYYLTLRY